MLLGGFAERIDPTSEKVDIEKALRDIEQYKHILVICHQPRVLRKVESHLYVRHYACRSYTWRAN